MISVLVVAAVAADLPALAEALEGAGLAVAGRTDCDNLVQAALRTSPDVLVALVASPDAALFRACEALVALRPLPIVVFTNDAQVEHMEHALRSGIQVWAVQGYAPQRLRPLVQLAQARFAHARGLQASLADISHRFEERKLVDRAKGILMRASQISEDEAFRMLRTASMHGQQRVGQVSRQVIDTARCAEAINRAGQLRMLSQRAVLQRALAVAGVAGGSTAPSQAAVLGRADSGLAALDKLISQPTFGDLMAGLRDSWAALQRALARPPALAELPVIDALSERALLAADRLVAALDSAGMASSLHVINVSGRQRMLGQRLAKQALLSALLGVTPRHTVGAAAASGADTEAMATVSAFELGLQHLRELPLSTRDIRDLLDRAAATWTALLAATRRLQYADGRRALAASSDALLELCEQLTQRYERSMQLLIG